MIKLLYITNGITGAGGLERVLSIKASYLAEHYNYEVHILTLNEVGKESFYEFSPQVLLHSIQIGGHPLNYLKEYLTGIKRVIKEVRPDVLSVCDDGLKGFFLPVLLGKPCPMIYERHVSKEIEMNVDFSIWDKRKIYIKWKIMEQLAAGFSKFVVLTNGNKKEWLSLTNMVVIPNPTSFYPKESSTLKNKKVIAVGKQGYQKGYDRLLEAWQLVHQKNPEWQLEIYGKIEPEQKLKEKAALLNVTSSVFFYAPDKDIKSKYLASSIYVMSSRYEGFGMVLIEAMACGVPCVSFDCNYGPSDIIQNEVDGYVVANGNIEALALKINDLIAHEDDRFVMGQKAKQNVQRFLPEIIVKQWDILFKGLVK